MIVTTSMSVFNKHLWKVIFLREYSSQQRNIPGEGGACAQNFLIPTHQLILSYKKNFSLLYAHSFPLENLWSGEKLNKARTTSALPKMYKVGPAALLSSLLTSSGFQGKKNPRLQRNCKLKGRDEGRELWGAGWGGGAWGEGYGGSPNLPDKYIRKKSFQVRFQKNSL